MYDWKGQTPFPHPPEALIWKWSNQPDQRLFLEGVFVWDKNVNRIPMKTYARMNTIIFNNMQPPLPTSPPPHVLIMALLKTGRNVHVCTLLLCMYVYDMV